MKSKIVKTIALVTAGVVASSFLAGCTTEKAVMFNQTQVDDMIADSVNNVSMDFNLDIDALRTEIDLMKADLEVTVSDSDNAQKALLAEKEALLNQAEMDAAVIAEYEALANEEEEKETQIESGYTEDEIALNTYVFGSSSQLLTDNKLSVLFDDEIRFDGSNYDAHEELELDAIRISTSTDGDVDFEDTPYMTIEESDSITYRYVFDDTIELDDGDAITDDDSLEIVLAGKLLEIVEIDEDEMTVRYGEEYLLNEGDEVEVNENTVRILTIGEDFVYVDVDGETEKIEEGDTETVGELSITALSVMEDDDGPDLVELKIGEDDTSVNVNNGDDLEDLFGEEFEDWDISWEIDEDDELVAFEIVYTEELTDEDDAFAVGDGLDILGYLTLSFSEVTDVDYNTLVVDYDYDDGVYSFDWDDEFEGEEEDAKTVYRLLDTNHSEWAFFNDDNVDFDDSDEYEDALVGTNLEMKGTDDLVLKALDMSIYNDEDDRLLELFGDIEDTEDARLYDYGFIVENAEDYFDDMADDKDATLDIEIPSEEVEATISITKQ